MNSSKIIVLKSIILLILFTTTSCSTKKKTWFHKSYHNTTAKYNGYFNGNESLKQGVKKIHKAHTEDYTAILPIYKTGDLKKDKKAHSYMDKAIKKGSVVIQNHSIKIKGKEYCKWIDDNYLLVGKAYFYKGEYDEAIKTFLFIKNEYKKNEIRFNASLWLIRSYVNKNDFMNAEIELGELENERNFPKKLEKELAQVVADYYLKQNNHSLALEQLKIFDQKTRFKRKKVRHYYIMAQIYQQYNNYNKAAQYYKHVIKSNAEYDMVFNAKMNLARSLQSGSQDGIKMKLQLLKMTKDDKNKEYLDQIYYTLAEIEIKNQDTTEAIKNYTLSTENSSYNEAQKALSFLALAQIEYNKSNEKKAKTYYDSTLYYMEEDFRLYDQSKNKHTILSKLVFNLDIIELQDSLQEIANLPEVELNNIINKIIQAEIDKEKEEREQEKLRQQSIYDNNRSNIRGEQFGNNTSGGKWYFYNPSTLSFGLSEFRKKWGKRKLEDNWRRKDKKTLNFLDSDTTNNESEEKEKISSTNTKDPMFYKNQLPKTKEDFAISDQKIKEAIYQAAIIYRDDLKKLTKSSNLFSQIPAKFPNDQEYSPLAYYNIYNNQISLKKEEQAKTTKNTLISKYPNSVCAAILKTIEYKTEFINKQNQPEKEYNIVLEKYLEKKHKEVIKETKDQKTDYAEKYQFLRALSFLALKDTVNFTIEAKKILNNKDSNEDIKKEVTYILETIESPEKLLRANELALSVDPYLYKEKAEHFLLILLSKKDLDVNYFKTIISDYHMKDFSNETFDISAMLFGIDHHLILIKRFQNANESMSYYYLFNENEAIKNILTKTQHKLMTITMDNFKEFYRNKDAEGYYSFFRKNYLEQQ